MIRPSIFFVILLCIATVCNGQGHIDHIKNQPYLKLDIDCDCDADSCVSMLRERYCTNLALQESDSLLVLSYDSLLMRMHEFSGDTSATDSITAQFIQLQKEWRDYRHAHCMVFWEADCGSICPIQYMSCMKALTDMRREELIRLRVYYEKQIELQY